MSTVNSEDYGHDRPMTFDQLPVAGDGGSWLRSGYNGSNDIGIFLTNVTQTPSILGAVGSKSCERYKFVMYLIASLVALCGLVGNTVAFIVFWNVKKKSSTFFLFQVRGLSM
jgi:hypothetical protein